MCRNTEFRALKITLETSQSAETAEIAQAVEATSRAGAFDLVAEAPWAIQPSMLQTIAAIARREGEGVEAVEARLGRPLQNARKVTVRDGVAIVPVTGPVFRYGNLFTSVSGATSLDVLALDFTAAAADGQVKAIVLAIDSPGGQANGIAELAQMIARTEKRVVAYVDGMAASAAYWLASAADEIVVSKTAEVGSIGAVVAIDTARSKSGPIEIVSGQSPKKRPDITTDEGRAQIQARVDRLAQVFIDDVAQYRGVTSDKVIADFGQGDVRMGSDAVALGMADRVGTLEDVIAELAGKQRSSTLPVTTTLNEETAMTLDELRAAHPDLCAALTEEGRVAGATAERERIFAIEAAALPGHEALIAQLKADGKTSGGEAAVAVIAAEKQLAGNRATQLLADAPLPVPHAAAPTENAAADDRLPLEERAEAQWKTDPAIRDEFQSLGAYTAYLRNHAAGRARVLGK